MLIKQIYDASLSQYAYLIGCQRSGEALLVDPQRDIDRYLKIAEENDLRITQVTETHIHADFLSGVRQFLHDDAEVTAYLSDEGDVDWKYEWAQEYAQVSLLNHGDTIQVGKIELQALHTPGHTPEHLSFLVTDHGGGADEPIALLTGDFVFVGDVGRPDLLESAVGTVGSQETAARALYQSILQFAQLADYIQVLPGHGAGSACGKALGAIPSSTVGYEKRFNTAIQTALQQGEDAFVQEILSGQPEPPVYFAQMKHDNKSGVAVLQALPQPTHLSTTAFLTQSQRPNAVVLDSSRGRIAFMDHHLKGALYAPIGEKYTTVAGSYLTSAEEIYLLLPEESVLEECVRSLVRIGVDQITGYILWEQLQSDPSHHLHLVATPRGTTATLDMIKQEYPKAQVIDVRGRNEYEEHHITGATHIAYTRLAHALPTLPASQLIVHCGSGLRASLAVPYLERMGKEVVYVDGFLADYSPLSASENSAT